MVIDWTALIIGLATAIAGLLGTYAANRKSAAVMELRMKMLEDKVSKHNQLIERTYKLEGQMTEVQHDIVDLKGRIAG